VSEYSIALEKQLELSRFIEKDGGRLMQIAGSVGVEEKAMRLALSLTGEAFYWDQRITPLIERAADVIPDWTLGEHMLEGDAAFYWFAAPLSMPQWSGTMADLCAVSWHRKIYEISTETRAVDFTGWAAIQDAPVSAAPVMSITWYPGESWREVLATRQDRLFQDLSDSPPEEAYRESDARDERFLRLLSASIAFLDQRILAPRIATLSRSDRRRVERLAPESLIRVVELRKREHATHPSTNEHRDYSCQWIVRGHWRQQWYPKLNRHQPKWITPYVKGPEDKPLKQPRATVFAVVR